MGERQGAGQVYRVGVLGLVDPSWSDWFEGMEVVPGRAGDGAAVTTLTGAVADQAALRGILLKIWDLNLTVVSLARLDVGTGEKEGYRDE